MGTMGNRLVNFSHNIEITGGGQPSLGCSKSSSPKTSILKTSSRKILLLCFLLLFSLLQLPAVSLNFEWQTSDEDIKYYRWQLDGEDDDKWTLVDGSATKVTLSSDTPDTKFYLQASYDGNIWSESSVAEYTDKTKLSGFLTLNFKWQSDDGNIKYYRYQMNGEDDEKWTVVDGATTNVTLSSDTPNPKFYLQASYDGVSWSESSVAEYGSRLSDLGFISLSWSNDEGYSFFRYQRDEENEYGWTVVDGKTASVIVPCHTGLNTYYVQSSYDGALWSDSGITTYMDLSCTCDTILWSWETEDEDIKYYRYQLEEMDDDKWTVVDSAVTGKELPALIGLNTLYVESSYDGNIWSDATVGTYTYEREPYRTLMYEFSLRTAPYSIQRIDYTIENRPTHRYSDNGLSLGIEGKYNLDSRSFIAFDLSADYYKYKGFHSYWDFKTVLTAGAGIIGSEESRNRVYITFGGGLDFVLRDDGKRSVYPLISYGVRDRFSLTENTAIGLGVDIENTIQKGSIVTHIIPSLSFSYTWGCKAGCKGGCR